jgi:type II secretory ATPase GspE/PulE/Tfp pilus assembly ATPase PilB-like protein
MTNPVEDSPIVRFVDRILEDSVERGVQRIRFERQPRSDWIKVRTIEHGEERTHYEERLGLSGNWISFTIMMEIDGTFEEVAMPPVALWEKTVSRLKVLARTVDYGPYKSVDGTIVLPLDENGSAEFYMTSNPDPRCDSEVMLVRKG